MGVGGAAVAPERRTAVDSRNMLVLIGRLVKDPELRYLPNGTPVAEFAVAVNRPVRKDDGSFEDSLDGFFDCQLFGGTAVTLAEGYHKGAELQVTGSLHQRKYKVGNGAGQRTVSKIEVRAKTVAPVLAAAKAQTASAPSQPEPQPA
jgi:single-strand DNA-binding protein